MCDHTSPLTSQIPKQCQAPNVSENSGRKTAGRLGHKSINWLCGCLIINYETFSPHTSHTPRDRHLLVCGGGTEGE